MAPSNSRYSAFPKRIFGLKCSQHRTMPMRQVLKEYGKQSGAHAVKSTLLERLVRLEAEVSENERAAIEDWFGNDGNSYKILRDLLSRVRREQSDSGDSGEILDYASECTITHEHECCVCMESMTSDHFPLERITTSCKHEPNTCTECLTTSINTQIPDVPWDHIKCPECPEVLTYEAVKKFASDEMFESFDNKAFLSAFDDVPTFAMCLGPGCGSGQIHLGGEDEPIMTCNKCGFKTCFTHKMPWHPDQTCEQYETERRERADQEASSEKLIEESSKPCANSACGYRITKIGGCDHMTCRRCGEQFCWECMAPWEQVRIMGNTAHATTCKYHTSNIVAPLLLIADILDYEDEV